MSMFVRVERQDSFPVTKTIVCHSKNIGHGSGWNPSKRIPLLCGDDENGSKKGVKVSPPSPTMVGDHVTCRGCLARLKEWEL